MRPADFQASGWLPKRKESSRLSCMEPVAWMWQGHRRMQWWKSGQHRTYMMHRKPGDAFIWRSNDVAFQIMAHWDYLRRKGIGDTGRYPKNSRPLFRQSRCIHPELWRAAGPSLLKQIRATCKAPFCSHLIGLRPSKPTCKSTVMAVVVKGGHSSWHERQQNNKVVKPISAHKN